MPSTQRTFIAVHYSEEGVPLGIKSKFRSGSRDEAIGKIESFTRGTVTLKAKHFVVIGYKKSPKVSYRVILCEHNE